MQLPPVDEGCNPAGVRLSCTNGGFLGLTGACDVQVATELAQAGDFDTVNKEQRMCSRKIADLDSAKVCCACNAITAACTGQLAHTLPACCVCVHAM